MLLFIQRETEVICSEVPVSIHLMLLFIEVSGVGSAVVEAFQYISCYSLSNCKEYRLYKQKGFNTSHVTLYRKPGTAKLPAESSFNTSHVTLYLKSFIRHFTRSILVSIHLMLLFIRRIQFQQLIQFLVSIHLMLLFINPLIAVHAFCCCRFNTSHVTLYRWKKFTIPSHICSFNTSHVTLYLFRPSFSFRTSCRFNTSHVTLYHRSRT